MIEPEQITAPSVSASEAPSDQEPDIQTIPDKFYGAALSAKLSDPNAEKAKDAKTSSPHAKTGRGMMIGIVAVILLAVIGGGFVYFNQELLFGEPQEPVQTPPVQEVIPPPPSAPTAPSNVTATATSPFVIQLNWQDTSNDEAGFRIERRTSVGDYQSVTSLPPNSSAYQDPAVEPQTSYVYRVIAMNAGGDSSPSNEYAVETPAEPPPPPEQEKLPPAGLDSDSDGLTDLEEPLYGTSPRDPDADRDTFLDGNEVFHLYNPASGVNVRLLESGLVKPVESSAGWTIYVPSTWTASVDPDGLHATITTGHGEIFTVAVQSNSDQKPIMEWYLAGHPGILSSQVALVTTKSGLEGLEGADLLTTYFPWGSSVLVFSYDLDGQTFVNFRQTYEMMKNSLRLGSPPVFTQPTLSNPYESGNDPDPLYTGDDQAGTTDETGSASSSSSGTEADQEPT